jgi:4'-phosphopantetheinyl transferase
MRVRVRPVPEVLTPAAVPGDGVDVWVAPLDAFHHNPATGMTADERARGDRYKHPRIRDQFARARCLLRNVLASYLGCRPLDVPIEYTPDGKPVLTGDALHFNLTHTEGLALVAVGPVRVGVDAEKVRPMPTADGLVDRFFADPERVQYRELPEAVRPEAFLRGWTCKEAVLKGVGCGARGLDRLVLDLDPRLPPRVLALHDSPGNGWSLACWHPADGFLAAIAVESGTVLEVVRCEAGE